MSAASLKKPSARERLLAAADELFYAEGVHTVGIDRVIEHAGVAKASLYSSFGNKEGLVRAYLEGRHEARQRRLLAGLDRFGTPRERILGVFDLMAEFAVAVEFRGCAFHNASAENVDGGAIEQVSDATRAWTRQLFTGLARDAGARDPAALAAQLVVLYDGCTTGARMDRSAAAARTARAIAATLLDHEVAQVVESR